MNLNIDEDRSLFFVEKKDVLGLMNNIYDSLIDISLEIKNIQDEQINIKKNIDHLRNILNKDLIIRNHHITDNLKLNDISMSKEEWNQYVNESRSISRKTSPTDNKKKSNLLI